MNDPPARPTADDLGRLIEVLALQAEASRRLVELIETRSLPLLERIALALERAPSAASNGGGRGRGRGAGIVEFRVAVDEGRWDQAEAIARDLALEHPDDPEASSLLDELGRTRQFAVDDLRQRIEAARQANDPDGAIRLRDDLAKILRGEAILEVDRPLVKWLMALIQRRLRTGTIRADVVVLADRVAESFGGTTEGASLRASLPTLRRCAGLCPKCAEPYTGVGDACPKCLVASAPPIPTVTPELDPAGPPEDEAIGDPGPEDEPIGEPIDLNDERFWQDPESSPGAQLDGGPDVGKDGG
jgi:hypothetical protein